MSVIAIIPARGGSKGIPHKNLAMCAGKPLVDWVIQAANDSELIDIAILSSDDPEILNRAWGKVLSQPRPPELAEDDTSTESVMEYALRNGDSDIIVLLQPTSPMTEGWQIDEAIKLINPDRDGYDCLVSVVKSHELTWAESHWHRDGVSLYEPMFSVSNRPRRQDLEDFAENGAIYITTSRLWVDNSKSSRIAEVSQIYEMPEEHRYQVDTPLDLEIVSMLLEKREAKKCASVSI